MSDVQVTEADREAVSALLQSLADKQKFAAVFSLVPADLYHHFAAHADRAVEAYKKKLANDLRQLAADHNYGKYSDADCIELLNQLADQLQQGAG